MVEEPSSSAGRSCTEPAGIKERFGTSSQERIASIPVVLSSRRALKPGSLGIPNASCRVGLRRSASTSSTRFPCCAMTTAAFTAVVVLPSLGSGLVTSSILRSAEASKIEVANARYASAIAEAGCATQITSSSVLSARAGDRVIWRCCGMIASDGIAVKDSTSAGSRRARFMPSRTAMTAALASNPRNSPM